jgi:hypothetical protein
MTATACQQLSSFPSSLVLPAIIRFYELQQRRRLARNAHQTHEKHENDARWRPSPLSPSSLSLSLSLYIYIYISYTYIERERESERERKRKRKRESAGLSATHMKHTEKQAKDARCRAAAPLYQQARRNDMRTAA